MLYGLVGCGQEIELLECGTHRACNRLSRVDQPNALAEHLTEGLRQ